MYLASDGHYTCTYMHMGAHMHMYNANVHVHVYTCMYLRIDISSVETDL